MNMKKYSYQLKWVHVRFEFKSLGPKGTIKKIIEYQTRDFLGEEVVNLALGDWNEAFLKTVDDVTSNNGDTNMILATVASSCVDMMSLHPEIRLLAQGITPARNRLYRMGIAKNWAEISSIIEIEGLRQEKWEPFQFGIDYDAFKGKAKPDSLLN
jgi:hypothetical protein